MVVMVVIIDTILFTRYIIITVVGIMIDVISKEISGLQRFSILAAV